MEDGDWGELKFLFFNGQGLHDTTYRLYTDKCRAMLIKSIRLMRQYKDCFTSTNPVPLVNTEKVGVYANRWPGDNRTLWTIYNSRFTTVRDKVITVAHRSGDRYLDAWNGKELTPVIRNGKAVIRVRLDPQGLGCVVQSHATSN